MTLEYAIKCLETGSKFPDFCATAEEIDEACKIACEAIQEKIDREKEAKESVKRVCKNCLWYIKKEEFESAECELCPGIWVEPDDYCCRFTKEEVSNEE